MVKEARKEFESLKARDTGICELPDIGARIQTLVLVMEQKQFLNAKPFLQPLDNHLKKLFMPKSHRYYVNVNL